MTDDSRQYIMICQKDFDNFITAITDRLRHEGHKLDREGHSSNDASLKGAGKAIVLTGDFIKQEYERLFKDR
jgi:hypothetical protein